MRIGETINEAFRRRRRRRQEESKYVSRWPRHFFGIPEEKGSVARVITLN